MEDVHFKRFHESYKFTACSMAVGLIYPISVNQKIRCILILLMILSICPFVILTLYNIYEYWTTRDIGKILINTTVIGPFVGGFLKMFLLNYYREKCKYLIDELNNDFSRCNCLPLRHKLTIDITIRSDRKYAEVYWTVYLVSSNMTFPLTAAAFTMYSQLRNRSEKYLVVDLLLPHLEAEARFDTPYYEVMFAYTLYIAVIFASNFIGYDVFFAVCINHACLKTRLYCMAMEDAMKAKTKTEMYDRVAEVVRSHLRLYRYADVIQDVFNTWIGVALIACTIQIGSCFYYIIEGYEFDIKYIVYTMATIVYIYQPCWYSSKLRDMCTESATRLYCCGWEARPELRVRKSLAFMIAGAQLPKEMVVFNMFAVNMELYVFILKTAYSVYTMMSS